MKIRSTCLLGCVFCLTTIATAEVWTRGDFSPEAININFDQFPDGSSVPNYTVVTTQYDSLGVVFSGPSAPEVSGNYQGVYGPLASPPNIVLARGNQIHLTFVHPVTGLAAPTAGVGADIIFRDTGDVSTLEVFGETGQSLGSVTTPPDQGDGDDVFIGFGHECIYSAEFSFDPSDSTVGLDNLIFEPVPEPATLSLLAIGGLALLRRRRGK